MLKSAWSTLDVFAAGKNKPSHFPPLVSLQPWEASLFM